MSLPLAALLGLAVILAAAAGVWLVSVWQRDASIADIGWGAGFVLLAWLYAILAGAWSPRAGLVLVLTTVWGGRLALHLFVRNHGRGEDPRYHAMRAAHGQAFWWRSLFTVFWLQAAILWFVSVPLLLAVRRVEAAGLTWIDAAGTVLFLLGFACEAVGDRQLARFKADPANRGRVLNHGLWRYTRHPNYFGDATLWWGLWLVAVATPYGWLTLLSPALMTFLLLRVSGVALLERGLVASKPAYAAYVARTSAFVPWPPKVSCQARAGGE